MPDSVGAGEGRRRGSGGQCSGDPHLQTQTTDWRTTQPPDSTVLGKGTPWKEGYSDTWALRTVRLRGNPKDNCSQLCGFSADFYFPSAVSIFGHPFIYRLEDIAP